MKKLYLAYMWAEAKDRMIEDHEMLMVVAENEDDAKLKCKEKSKLWDDVHVDYILEVSNIDWYNVSLEKWWAEELKKVMGYTKY